MTRLTRRTFFGVGLAGALLATGCTGRPAAPATTFKIAAHLPLTGRDAEAGRRLREAFELYAAEVNASGGINGLPLELMVRDDRGEVTVAAQIALELSRDPSIDATLGGYATLPSMAAAPVLFRANIPNISPTVTHPDYTALGKGLFRGSNAMKLEGWYAAERLLALGVRRVAVVHQPNDLGTAATGGLGTGLRGERLDTSARAGSGQNSAPTSSAGPRAEMTSRVTLGPNSKDLAGLVSSLRKDQPEAVFAALAPAEAIRLAQQFAASGWQPMVVTTSELHIPEFPATAGSAAIDWQVQGYFLPDSDRPAVTGFLAAYRARYGRIADRIAAVGHDSIRALGEAKRRVPESGMAGRLALRRALGEITFDGVTGRIAFDSSGDPDKTPTWLTVTENGYTAR